MRRALGVAVFLLLLVALSPEGLLAQTRGRGQLKGNYPNPFNPTTTIQFELIEENFVGEKPALVSIRIYNVLEQFVATPKALKHARGDGVSVESLQYNQPGAYEAYWDGTDRTGRKVASGIYYYVLVVNGVKVGTSRMIVQK